MPGSVCGTSARDLAGVTGYNLLKKALFEECPLPRKNWNAIIGLEL